MAGMTDAPLIVTLALDDTSQQFFNNLRQQHFPAERNYLDAHLTLFHHLPAHENIVNSTLENAAKRKAMNLEVTQVKFIGNGVAYQIVCHELSALHKKLQQEWENWLIPQDQQKLWPHITVQNKVDPPVARLLAQELTDSFSPFQITGTGLKLYEYLGGPWKLKNFYEFTTTG